MMFWDASAMVPLCLEEPKTSILRGLVENDAAIVAWWGSLLECFSAFARLRRDNILKPTDEDRLRKRLEMLSDVWTEIQPGKMVQEIAARLLLSHPLSAADSLQLAAAILWAEKHPRGQSFVCLDNRLRMAARKEGFTLLPA